MKNKKIPDNQITVYQTSEGGINIEVQYSDKNIWLPQKRMAELFGCSADNISLHLKNIYKEKELDEISTTEDFSVVQLEGKREVTRNVTCPGLDQLNRIVTMYLDFAELQAVRNIPMYMKDWIKKRIQNLHLSGGDSSIEEKQYPVSRKLSSGFHPKAAEGLI